MQPQTEPSDEEDIVEVRCRGGLHFKVIDGHTIEIKCKHCSDRDTAVMHRISLPELELKTFEFADPTRGRGARSHRKETP